MLAMFSTLMILIAASFALIAAGMTLRNSWGLIIGALAYVPGNGAKQLRSGRSARGHVTVSFRAPARLMSAAA